MTDRKGGRYQMESLLIWEHTWEQIRERAPQSVAIQPIASVEQHGPHLPLATDSLIVEEFSRRLQEQMSSDGYPALFLPLMPYGKSNEHMEYPGTITYSAETFLSVLMDIGRSCARAGFPKLVFLNAHGGNLEVLAMAAREIRIETGMEVFSLQPSLVPKDRKNMGCPMTPQELRFGIHGGWVETSAILSIRPELVQREHLHTAFPECYQETKYLDFSGRVSVGWRTRDVTATGAVGDSSEAAPEDGERWFSNVTQETYRVFREILSFRRQAE